MKEYKNRAKEHLSKYKENILGIKANGVFKGKEYAHILPIESRNNNFITDVEPPQNVHLHMYAHHLNSSQVMCINFFAPLLRSNSNQNLLLELLKELCVLSDVENTFIKEATFEKVVNFDEGTNFDFYLELSTGEKVFFEIKYTEDGFGKTHLDKNVPLKYQNKWNSIYSKHINNSLLIKDINEIDFYEHYQIWRNVSYARTKSDYVIFLFPFENKKALYDIERTINLDEKYNENIKAIDWNNIVGVALKLSSGTELENHFKEFYSKYLEF